MLLPALALAVAVATPQHIASAGNGAYLASRAFQVEELRALQARERWPTAEEHREITEKLTIAREGIDDSLLYGAVLAGPVPPQLSSMLLNVGRAVAALHLLVGPRATKLARTRMQDFQARFAALFDLFPVAGHEDEHPPRPQ